MRYKPYNFKPYELVSRNLYRLLGDQSYFLFDWEILITADQIRIYVDTPAYINTWYWNGKHEQRGFRRFDCPIGAKNSMHKEGKAIDMTFRDIPAQKIREEIIKNRKKFPFITRIEDKVDWLHFDNKYTGQEDIVLFNP